MAWNALSKASKLEEQAVSMAVLGPREGEDSGLNLETISAKNKQAWDNQASVKAKQSSKLKVISITLQCIYSQVYLEICL